MARNATGAASHENDGASPARATKSTTMHTARAVRRTGVPAGANHAARKTSADPTMGPARSVGPCTKR